MSSQINETEIKEFFDAWTIYDQVLDQNYMFHDQLYADVRIFLEQRFSGRPMTMLDLGCGSARHLAPILTGLTVSRYLGYDLSDSALAQAAHNLQGIGCAELRQGDLFEGLKTSRERYDLIFSSFALHHLVTADKAVFFEMAYERLQDDGILLLIDVMREEDEALPVYLDRYCGWIRSEWVTLPQNTLATICNHVCHNDYPETASELSAMASRAGFGSAFEIGRCRWHRTWCFAKQRP